MPEIVKDEFTMQAQLNNTSAPAVTQGRKTSKIFKVANSARIATRAMNGGYAGGVQ